MTALTAPMSVQEVLLVLGRATFPIVGSPHLADEICAARAAVAAMAEREAALVRQVEIYKRALELVESTFQPTSGRLGVGRYSFPANGLTADAVRGALANTSINGASSDALVKEVEELRSVVAATLSSRAAEVEAQAKRIAELEEDFRRIEWLALNPRGASTIIDGKFHPCVFWGVSSAPENTLRQAIDAARAEAHHG